MVVPSIPGNVAQDPYALPPAREHAWRDPFPVGGSLQRAMPPTAASAFGLQEENPYEAFENVSRRDTALSAPVGLKGYLTLDGEIHPSRIGVHPAAAESAASVLRAFWIQHLENMLTMWGDPPQRATTWLASALDELEEIDREVLEDGLPPIKAETRGEAARILQELSGQTIQPTTYPTNDGEIVIHFQSPGVPAAVLIELSNDGQAACFSCVGGKNRRRRYGDSSGLPDAFVMAQLEALAAEAGA